MSGEPALTSASQNSVEVYEICLDLRSGMASDKRAAAWLRIVAQWARAVRPATMFRAPGCLPRGKWRAQENGVRIAIRRGRGIRLCVHVFSASNPSNLLAIEFPRAKSVRTRDGAVMRPAEIP